MRPRASKHMPVGSVRCGSAATNSMRNPSSTRNCVRPSSGASGFGASAACAILPSPTGCASASQPAPMRNTSRKAGMNDRMAIAPGRALCARTFSHSGARSLPRACDLKLLDDLAVLVREAGTARPVLLLVDNLEHQHVHALLEADVGDVVVLGELPVLGLLEHLLAVEVDDSLVVAAGPELDVRQRPVGVDVADGVGHAILGHLPQKVVDVEEVALGLVHLPHQLLAVDLDLVAGLGSELGLAGDLLLAEGVGAALALVQGDGGQQEPGGDESLLVQAPFARDGAAGEEQQRGGGQNA